MRDEYFDDASFKALHTVLMQHPDAGDVIKCTRGCAKSGMRTNVAAKESGGLRVINFWKSLDDQFWLFTVYDKDEADDLTADQRKLLKQRLEAEIKARSMSK